MFSFHVTLLIAQSVVYTFHYFEIIVILKAVRSCLILLRSIFKKYIDNYFRMIGFLYILFCTFKNVLNRLYQRARGQKKNGLKIPDWFAAVLSVKMLYDWWMTGHLPCFVQWFWKVWSSNQQYQHHLGTC